METFNVNTNNDFQRQIKHLAYTYARNHYDQWAIDF